jgi:hypothetical protein
LDCRGGWRALGLIGIGRGVGNPPRGSDSEARHARQQQREQRLIWRRPWQVQANLRLQDLDADRQLDQPQLQCVELSDPPTRSARHQRAQALASGVDAMNLEHVLRRIQPDR